MRKEMNPETENMKKISYRELAETFRKHEREATDGSHLTGYIVFSEDSFTQPYGLEARTYGVSSGNKAYMPNMGGYSIYGSAIDGTDANVRLERYMREEKGGSNGWKVDYCYIK